MRRRMREVLHPRTRVPAPRTSAHTLSRSLNVPVLAPGKKRTLLCVHHDAPLKQGLEHKVVTFANGRDDGSAVRRTYVGGERVDTAGGVRIGVYVSNTVGGRRRFVSTLADLSAQPKTISLRSTRVVVFLVAEDCEPRVQPVTVEVELGYDVAVARLPAPAPA